MAIDIAERNNDEELIQKCYDAILCMEPSSYNNLPRCVVCQANVRTDVFIRCGHYVTCSKCACRLEKCPLCRAVGHAIAIGPGICMDSFLVLPCRHLLGENSVNNDDDSCPICHEKFILKLKIYG